MRINNFRGETNWKLMPQKIDLIDRKIMYLLCKNARLSNTAIGKTLKLKREVVAYRIKKMQENGFLNGFFTRINPRKIGFLIHFIYLKLKTPINEKELIEDLMRKKEITNLKNTGGRFDLRLETTTNSLEEFDLLVRNILDKYNNIIQDYSILNVIDEEFTGVDLVLEKEKLELSKLKEFKEIKGSSFQKELGQQVKNNKIVPLHDLDKKILFVIKLNGRISLKEISEEVKSNFPTVNQRIKNLVKEGVITNFTAQFSLACLGYQMYPVLFYLRNINEKKLITFLRLHPNITWYYKLVGNWNYQFNIMAKSNAHFHDILNDIREQFSENIVSFDTLIVFNSFKVEQRVE